MPVASTASGSRAWPVGRGGGNVPFFLALSIRIFIWAGLGNWPSHFHPGRASSCWMRSSGILPFFLPLFVLRWVFVHNHSFRSDFAVVGIFSFTSM